MRRGCKSRGHRREDAIHMMRGHDLRHRGGIATDIRHRGRQDGGGDRPIDNIRGVELLIGQMHRLCNDRRGGKHGGLCGDLKSDLMGGVITRLTGVGSGGLAFRTCAWDVVVCFVAGDAIKVLLGVRADLGGGAGADELGNF